MRVMGRWFRRALGATLLGIVVGLASAANASNINIVGTVSYSFVGGTGTLKADRIQNDSPGGTISGTLRIELWAFATPYTGAAQNGYRMAQYVLGQLNGGFYFFNIDSGSIPFTLPPDGTWYLTFVVTEYTGGPTNQGYDPRDYVNFANTLVIGVPPPTANKVPAVEYYHAQIGQFFLTAQADEQYGLDNGLLPGWARTGNAFFVWDAPTGSAQSVYRLFTVKFANKAAHFYTTSAAERDYNRVENGGNWTYEKVAFFLTPAIGGACSPGAVPIYRMFNNGQTGAPNHRFTTSYATYLDFTLNRNWAGEGVVFCAPQ